MSLKTTFARQDITSVAAGNTMAVDDLDVLAIHLSAPVAWSGVTVAFEGSINGTDFVPIAAVDVASTSRVTAVVSTTAAGAWKVDTAGLVAARVNVTARTSGTIRVDAQGFA